jgi:hypothetical protein
VTEHSGPAMAGHDERTAIRSPAITGYAIMMPGGWRQVPVRHGTRKAITNVLGEVFARFPPDLARTTLMPCRLELERRMTEMARQARKNAAMDLYLPVEYIHGVTVPASIVVSRGTLGESGFVDMDEIMAQMTADSPDASPVTVDSVTGMRFERTADPAPGAQCGAQQVDYVLPVPGRSGDWLITAFSTLDSGPDGQFTQLLVKLFDAVMSTFRWTRD